MQFFKSLKSNAKEYCGLPELIFLLSFIFAGGFHDYFSCLLSLLFSIFLFLKIRKNKALQLRINPLSIAVCALVLFYGLSVIWAVDRGMALVGFLKFLPLLLYLLLLQQSAPRKKALRLLPYFAALLALLTAALSPIPFFKEFFLVAGRLAGPFQYPNTFALFLLISELLLLKKAALKWPDCITLALLIGGLLYTGSRAVFILFLISNFLMLLLRAPKKRRIRMLAVAAAAAGLLLAIALLAPEGNILSRYLKIGLNQSTFLGRFLYMQDALPLLWKHPFGLGYFGYLYRQGALQTGVYNVSYVHNDFMQIALDAGILAALLLLGAILAFLFKKKTPLADKLIIAVFSLHTLFDFNLQFIGMFLLLLLLLYDESGKQLTLRRPLPFQLILPLLAAVNLYMSIPLALTQCTAYEASDRLYPYYTRNKILLLQDQEDIGRAAALADAMLEYNTQYYAPYSIKAKYCYSQGDFAGVMENKKQVFARCRFEAAEYEEYAYMLVNGILAYEQQGDAASAGYLREELSALQALLEENASRISKLGGRIADQPLTSLPEELLKYAYPPQEKAGDFN